MLDAIDLQILALLQKDARIPNNEIARQIGLVPSATSERVKKLNDKGFINAYEVRLDPKKVGLPLLAFVQIRTDELVSETRVGGELCRIAEIQEVHRIAGDDCYVIKVRARDTQGLSQFLRETIGTIKGVRSTRTIIALETFKEESTLPLTLLQTREKIVGK